MRIYILVSVQQLLNQNAYIRLSVVCTYARVYPLPLYMPLHMVIVHAYASDHVYTKPAHMFTHMPARIIYMHAYTCVCVHLNARARARAHLQGGLGARGT